MRRIILIVILALTAGALPERSAAQEHVRIVGRVVEEESGVPIPGTDIIVRTRDDRFLRAVVSDDSGRFVVEVPRAVPAVRLHASRLGYRRNTTPSLWFDGSDFFEVEVRLDREAILLAPLAVLARSERSMNPVLSGFEHRLERGIGVYITRADIERRNPARVTDMLAEVPGVRLTSSGYGTRRTISINRPNRPTGCPVQLFIDGMLVTSPADPAGPIIDEYVSPLSIEGIEIYDGLSTVPAEFLTPDAECGVVVLWTRRGI